MYAKYRLFLDTQRGGYFLGAVNSVNDLLEMARRWLEGSIGSRVYDDEVATLIIMKLDDRTGSYILDNRISVSSRDGILRKLHDMGGR
jgi:hypothetical protein